MIFRHAWCLRLRGAAPRSRFRVYALLPSGLPDTAASPPVHPGEILLEHFIPKAAVGDASEVNRSSTLPIAYVRGSAESTQLNGELGEFELRIPASFIAAADTALRLCRYLTRQRIPNEISRSVSIPMQRQTSPAWKSSIPSAPAAQPDQSQYTPSANRPLSRRHPVQ